MEEDKPKRGSAGGRARALALTPERRREIAAKGGRALKFRVIVLKRDRNKLEREKAELERARAAFVRELAVSVEGPPDDAA